MQQADRDDGLRHDGLSSQEWDELRRLRRENKQLREEREILSKAAAWFAKEARLDSAEAFGFVMANQATYSVSTLCRVLGVSPSGYYAWRNRVPSRRKVADAELTVLIREIHCSSRRTYGAPRVHAELSDQGLAVSQKRVARLMLSQGLQGASRQRWIRTIVRQEKARPAPDLVRREFTVPAPNRL